MKHPFFKYSNDDNNPPIWFWWVGVSILIGIVIIINLKLK